MTTKSVVLTREGLEKIKKELVELKEVKRKEISEKIKRALEQGDLSENAEYAQAKEEQAFLEGRILEIEGMIKNAKIIDEKAHSTSKVDLGSTVRIKITNNGEVSYTIVGSSETDPSKGRISNESPMGQTLLDHKVGDHFSVKAPGGLMECEILEIK